MALAMIMVLCLLVYNLGERQLRQGLSAAHQYVPNQLGEPTSNADPALGLSVLHGHSPRHQFMDKGRF